MLLMSCQNIPNGTAPNRIVNIKPAIKVFSYPMVIDKMLTNICTAGSQYIMGLNNIDIKRSFSSDNAKNNDLVEILWGKLIKMHIINFGKRTKVNKLNFISEIKQTTNANEFIWTIKLKSHNDKFLWGSSVKFKRKI